MKIAFNQQNWKVDDEDDDNIDNISDNELGDVIDLGEKPMEDKMIRGK